MYSSTARRSPGKHLSRKRLNLTSRDSRSPILWYLKDAITGGVISGWRSSGSMMNRKSLMGTFIRSSGETSVYMSSLGGRSPHLSLLGTGSQRELEKECLILIER